MMKVDMKEKRKVETRTLRKKPLGALSGQITSKKLGFKHAVKVIWYDFSRH
jgi:hypothetical protein